ncbi:MAG: mechanosensitive ion channel domain-containing protein [Myxococcota bacterium]
MTDSVLGTDALHQLIASSIDLLSTWGLSVAGAVTVLLVGRWLAALLRRNALRAMQRSKLDPSLVPFFASAVYYLALAVVVIAVLNLFGVQTASLVAVLGAAGLAVGLALQGSLSNFSAGVVLLILRPIRVGDFVEVSGNAGTVIEIGLFTTMLNTSDNIRIVVPNSNINGQTIKNYSFNETRRNDMVIGISYDDDIGKAIGVIRAVLDADERVLKDPEPTIGVIELADSSVNLTLRPWCQRTDYFALRLALHRELKEKLEAAGCSLPYPQRDVHLSGTSE